MGYTGSATIAELQKRAKFVRITNAGLSRKPCPRRADHARGAELSDALGDDSGRAPPGGDRDPRRGDCFGARRRAAGRHHRHALFQAAPLCRIEGPARRARTGVPRHPPHRASGRQAAGRRCSGLAEDEPALARALRRAARARAATRRRASCRELGTDSAWLSPRAFAAGDAKTNGRRCWSARRSTCASTLRGHRATRCSEHSRTPSRRR